MGQYENPEIPEGINVSPQHPLKELALLLAGVSGIMVLVALALSLMAGYLVRYVPFSQEKALVATLNASWQQPPENNEARLKEQYLQALANQLASEMGLPSDMSVTVHYSPRNTVNALATLGGNIIIFQGLIDVLPNENALAMVMAHEISHIRSRHPIIALGRGFAVVLAISSLTGIGDEIMQRWVNSMGMLTVLSFSRSQESEADEGALQALLKKYGHVDGAEAFFEYASRQQHQELSTLLSTHPGIEERMARIAQFKQEHVAAGNHTLQPLPGLLKSQK